MKYKTNRKKISKLKMEYYDSELSKKNKSKNRQPNQGEEERRGIQGLIKECVLEEKTTKEIIDALKSKYPNSKLECYYEGYIEHHRKKVIVSRDNEER